MSDRDLPQGWIKVQLNDLVKNPKSDLVDGPFGSNLKSNEYVESGIPVLKIQNIKANRFVEKRLSYVTPEKAAELSRHSFIAGDLMITKLGEPLGLCCEVPSHLKHGIFVADLMRLRPSPEIISSKFLLHAINSVVVQNQFKEITKGTTRQRVNLSIVRDINIELPPLAEQHRIVAKIEELFSELDKGIENLKTAQAQLKVYRQALLKHAFEGKLTAQWREQHRDELESAAALQQRIQQARAQRYRQQLADWEAGGKQGSKPKAPKSLPPLTAEELAELPRLPEGWGWIRLGEVFAESPKNGIYKSAEHYGEGFSIIRIDDFYDGALSRTSGFKKVMLSAEEIETFTAHVGDILVNRVNSIEYLGKCCEVRGLAEPVVFESNIMKLTLATDQVSNIFVTSYLSSYFGRRRLCANAKHAVNQASINQTDVAMTPIPLAHLREQKTIAEQLAANLSEVDQLELTLATTLQQAEALRQSILKRAFSGQLVAQDANDEPASVLLARIKAERSAQSAVAKPRKIRQAAADPAHGKSNVIPFPVRLPNISATDLHAGILARAYQHHENTPKYLACFGHVKAEKIAHLVEAHLGIDLEREPIKDAAGPNDYPHLMKVESRARKANWFDVKKKKDADAYAFSKKHGFDALLLKTMNALGERADEVDALISLLLPLNSRQAEIVATLYAAWNNLLLQGQSPDDEAIVHEARENWHASKLKIERDKFFRGLQWMREKGLVPSGNGRYVGAKARPETMRKPS